MRVSVGAVVFVKIRLVYISGIPYSFGELIIRLGRLHVQGAYVIM